MKLYERECVVVSVRWMTVRAWMTKWLRTVAVMMQLPMLSPSKLKASASSSYHLIYHTLDGLFTCTMILWLKSTICIFLVNVCQW